MVFNKVQRALGVSGGGVVIACSLLVMWLGVAKNVETDAHVANVVSRSVDINVSSPDPSNNGKLVIAAGNLSSSEMYEDEYIKPVEMLVVRRRVEMFQWVEDLPAIDKVEEPAAPDKKASYSMQWFERQVDFFNFQEPQGHENPLFQVTPRQYQSSQIRFGGLDGSRLARLIKRFEPLSLTPELLKDSSLPIVDNKIVVRRDPASTGTTLGDMRVWYEVVAPGEYTFLVRQNDERSIVGASVEGEPYILKGIWSKENFSEGTRSESSEENTRFFLLGAGLLFAGLLSLLMPHAARFDLQPHLPFKGKVAVVVVSGGITGVVAVLFAVMSFTN